MACSRALPRSYQATPSIPGRRRATLRKEVRPSGRQPETESQLAAGPGPSPARRTSPTAQMRTASLGGAARRARRALLRLPYSDGARARSHRELARARGDYAPIMQSVRPSALLLVVRSDMAADQAPGGRAAGPPVYAPDLQRSRALGGARGVALAGADLQ